MPNHLDYSKVKKRPPVCIGCGVRFKPGKSIMFCRDCLKIKFSRKTKSSIARQSVVC